MPFNSSTNPLRQALPQPEILAYPDIPLEIDSVVVAASGVVADASGPYINRYYMIAGTPLSKKSDGTYEQFTSAGGQSIVGILYDTIEFADNKASSNEPAAMITARAVFNAAKIVDFATYETELNQWASASGVGVHFV